jgi:hypothetical protein
MKVVALLVGSLLGAATIPHLPPPETRGWRPWMERHFDFEAWLEGPLQRWFAPPREQPKLRFE